jgi:hypothetical protein
MVSCVDNTITTMWEHNFWLDRHLTRTQVLAEFIEMEARGTTHTAQDSIAAMDQVCKYQ